MPIVALTAHAMDGDSDSMFEAGVDHYITKPLRKNELVDFIQKFHPKGARSPFGRGDYPDADAQTLP